MARPPKISASFRLSQSVQTMLKSFADEKQLNMTDVVEMALVWFMQEAQNKPELLRLPPFATPSLSEHRNEISTRAAIERQDSTDNMFEEFEEEQKRLVAEGKEKLTDISNLIRNHNIDIE